MGYQSVDQLQGILTEDVFNYAKDPKKAAGRALGTLVEVITFYLLQAWGFGESVAIERGLKEYGNPRISHNVEYSLHPITYRKQFVLEGLKTPFTVTKLMKALQGEIPRLDLCAPGCNVLLTTKGILRNSCVLASSADEVHVCFVERLPDGNISLVVVGQRPKPYAMFECKRVGIEEGNKKGPQTIEKAKQGAYVARTVSALQRIRLSTGELQAVIPRPDGSLYFRPYQQMMKEIICSSRPELLKGFVLTVGVVSNHGNWFTSGNQNKEMMVLAQSYDWLLFLTDDGLAEFVQDLLLKPKDHLEVAKAAFLRSYAANKKANCFTKVQMDIEADAALQRFFSENIDHIESWFNIISPEQEKISTLQDEMRNLAAKDWEVILAK